MSPASSLTARMNCPCCGYPTLPERNAYEICELCNWEDDGQDEENAEEVCGGPNSDYSLAEARKNFKLYRVMYAPERDQRITGRDSPLEYDTKGRLMAAFESMLGGEQVSRAELEAEIERLERLLQDETTRQVREYERKHSGA
ncbi:hypothetical protein AGMMS49543_23860 [Betaproteobacteria bacterium]|nr:hypothetical protein AGMMS49543_23860 [Betaproteobacteria bacterium]GHU19492.1 hypothetical protein AGMMS50243_11630 [Betaproteobacteria bacterium]